MICTDHLPLDHRLEVSASCFCNPTQASSEILNRKTMQRKIKRKIKPTHITPQKQNRFREKKAMSKMCSSILKQSKINTTSTE